MHRKAGQSIRGSQLFHLLGIACVHHDKLIPHGADVIPGNSYTAQAVGDGEVAGPFGCERVGNVDRAQTPLLHRHECVVPAQIDVQETRGCITRGGREGSLGI